VTTVTLLVTLSHNQEVLNDKVRWLIDPGLQKCVGQSSIFSPVFLL